MDKDVRQIRHFADSGEIDFKALFADGVKSISDFQESLMEPDRVCLDNREVDGHRGTCVRIEKGRRRFVVDVSTGTLLAACARTRVQIREYGFRLTAPSRAVLRRTR